MDNLATISFSKSPESEVDRIIQTCIQTASGFYLERGFVVIPKKELSVPNEVLLPPLDYNSVPEFWTIVDKLPSIIPTSAPAVIRSQIGILYNKKNLYRKSAKQRDYQKKWRVVEKEFWKLLKVFLPEKEHVINEIIVYLTDIGTISSWDFHKKEKRLLCYLREPAGLGHVAEAVITSLIRTEARYKHSWSESEAITDYILTKTKIATLFPDYKPTLTSLATIPDNLRKKSQVYLQKLNINSKRVIEIREKAVFIEGKKIDTQLTKNEAVLVKLLIQNKSEITDYDQLSCVLWGPNNFKSLWALNKAMQRLRCKISKNSERINIGVVRGRGYILEYK